MSMSFRHHPDQIIYLGDESYPLDWFKQHEPEYSLPVPAIAREYIPGNRHSLYSATDQWGGEFPWKEGDRYLNRANEFKLLWQAAQTVDSLPLPDNQPDWSGFRTQILLHSAYLRLVLGHQLNSVLNVHINSLFWRIESQPNLFPELAQTWKKMVENVPLTPLEISLLNTVALSCKVPIRLNKLGLMEFL